MSMVNSSKHFISSTYLNRDVECEVYVPSHVEALQALPVLVVNDGQDMQQVGMAHILDYMWRKNICAPFIAVSPHTTRRLEEYGVSGVPDFKNRGALAEDYAQFVAVELREFVKGEFENTTEQWAICGFSLGALSAFDVAWHHALFKKVGAFSPSFWWRKRDLKDGYTDADRIMHQVVKDTSSKPSLSIWFQCGTMDETNDRNNNGIIDSIDDCLDLMKDLESAGFENGRDMFYTETIAGRHTQETYGIMLPFFLHWAFPFNP